MLKPAYNVGVCGFKNEELKQKYINHYFDSLKKVPVLDSYPQGFIPDLIIEQQHLFELCQGYDVKTILGKNEWTINNDIIFDDAIKLDYQHVLFIKKFRDFEKIRNELKNSDPTQCRILDAVTGYNKTYH